MPHYARGWRGNGGGGGKKKQKPNTKLKNPKAPRAGRGACLRSAAPEHRFWPGAPRRDGVRRDKHRASPLSPEPASRVSVLANEGTPLGPGRGQTGRLRTVSSDDFMFSSWKSQGKSTSQNHTTYNVLYGTCIRFCKMGNLLWISEFLEQMTGVRPGKVPHPSGSIRERLTSRAF